MKADGPRLDGAATSAILLKLRPVSDPSLYPNSGGGGGGGGGGASPRFIRWCSKYSTTPIILGRCSTQIGPPSR